jgi:L,D-transpeptidase catalytic domain
MMRDIGPDTKSTTATLQHCDSICNATRNARGRRYPTPRGVFFLLGLACASLPVAAAPATGPSAADEVRQAHDPAVQAQTGVVHGDLSPQELQASQIANQNGDQNFLMVNKTLGRIILFQDGKPIFSDAALTGESMADRIPADATSLKLSEFVGAIEYKVTPAGRFTLTRGYQKAFGLQFNINEIKGPDWTIPIQQIYPETPSERREYRLKSVHQGDNQITHGGINVSAETMHLLASKLPEDRAVVLYVLPHDESKTAQYLTLHPGGQPPAVAASPEPAPDSPARAQAVAAAEALSDQGRQVSQIAERRGDRTYIMIDKPFGKLIFFEDGKPTYVATALTGESLTDRLPAGALKKPFSKVGTVEDKVTPAGRFTLTRSYDSDYGQLFSINEIHGPDWEIAIHQVYLGTPSERRLYRLESRRPEDNHVSHGCINVTKDTIKFLLGKLAKTKRPVLYVLPHDQARTQEFFIQRGAS